MRDETAPARFLWLPPGLRPPVAMAWRQERIFLLVGVAAMFAGYDTNVFGLAVPQIQASLHIPENQIGLTVSYFRIATLAALLLCSMADLVGRRRLLLVTIFGQAIFTLLTAFAADYPQFVWAQILTRVFGYAEEMLCFVVIAEEVAAGARGWANGALSALNYTGAGLASLAFLGVTVLPFGWRALYVIGTVPLLAVGFFRRTLPETQRFAALGAMARTRSRWVESLRLVRDLTSQYPMRLATILIAAAAFGFGLSSASVLSSKYLQSVFHYSPLDINLVFIPGGLVGLALAILAGRISDRIGRKITTFFVVSVAGAGFALFYSGASGAWLPPLWILSFFGFFSGEAMIAGFALEIVPTHYRATVSALRYVAEIGAGALSLALEGRLYDHFQGHAPAIQSLLVAVPIALAAILALPEPSGKTLEEMAA